MSPLIVFGVGLGSVFAGMALLYISILLSAAIVPRLEKSKSEKGKK